MKKVLLYFVAYVCIQLIVVTPFQIVANATGRMLGSSEIIISSVLSNVIAVAVFAIAKWHPLSFNYLKSKPWTTLYWSTIMAIGMLIPSQFIEELIPEALTKDVLADVFKETLGNPWAFVALAVMAPLAEEVIFRGAIQNVLLKTWKGKPWYAIAFTALLFAAIHGNPAQMPHAFLIGLLLGWLAFHTGSIVPGILIHAINNSFAFVLYQVYPQSYDMNLIDFFGDSYLRLSGAIALSLLLFVPALLQIKKGSVSVNS